MAIESRKKSTCIVRVVATYRVEADNVSEARERMSNYLQERVLPKDIRVVGKAEVLSLRGLF